ncbi:MAG TPA: O-antigen ligase family protein [Solirubrobacteraceae bacterium]|nr:O-antigen ligase family protein [Solirubrobacteraceae bacterium]
MTTWIAQRPFAGRPGLPATLAVSAAAAALAAGAAVAIGTAALAIPLALAACVFLVRERLALLTLFLYVGLFKEQAVVEAFPLDVTLGLGLLLAGVCFVRWASRRAHSIPIGLAAPVTLIGLMLVISLSWTPSPDYGSDKAARFLTLTVLATVAPFFLIDGERDVRRFLAWLVAVAVVAGAITLVNPPAEGDRLTIGSAGNTIGVSQLLCTAAVILLVGALTDWVRPRGWAVVVGLGLIGIAAAVGSRGPILGLVLALAATGALWLARVPRKVLPVLVVVVLGVALLPFVSLPETSAERLGGAVRDPVGVLQSNARYTTFGQAIELIEDDPLAGIGAGGFQSVGALAYPPEDYPHNLFLEVWSELGLAAVLVLIASIVAVLAEIWRGAWRASPGPEGRLRYVISAVVVFTLLAAQVSGDVNENRAFWTSFGLAWLIVQYGVSVDRRERDNGYT